MEVEVLSINISNASEYRQMQNPTLLDKPSNLVRAIDQQKLVRSVLQRIANSSGRKIYAAELRNGVVEPDGDRLGWLTELAIKK